MEWGTAAPTIMLDDGSEEEYYFTYMKNGDFKDTTRACQGSHGSSIVGKGANKERYSETWGKLLMDDYFVECPVYDDGSSPQRMS
ncbi:hypothetical protein PC110_g4505 [Phytophthora cactorum]|uniref:Uncharacterized protein n=1 Tax=Phytophthora cactorum TaxID=29920 RepID=A0A329SU51_9STRA|nr:hypothetical protein PC110_g4505 [Phytophthora cactorum]